METKLEDLTSTMVEIWLTLGIVHFDRILHSYPPTLQRAIVLGVHESLDAEHSVKMLHHYQNAAGAVR